MKTLCGLISPIKDHSIYFHLTLCGIQRKTNVLCETRKIASAMNASPVKIQIESVSPFNHSHLKIIHCPLGHVSRDFLACDYRSTCWSSNVNLCRAPLSPHPPLFMCSNGVERMSYTLVCDFRPDCSDESDESFCEFPPCDLLDPFHCSSRQCVSRSMVCDGQKNCHNAMDEDMCSGWENEIYISPAPPAIVNLNQQGRFTIHKLNQSQLSDLKPVVCPETHFQCPDNGYCMPVFLRCNGVYDCLGHEDEVDCNSYTCPGFYRCRGSRVCLHPDQLCDDIFQCLQNDDELLCDLSCPGNCTCYGLSLYCRRSFRVQSISNLRFLDARGARIQVSDLLKNVLLIYLCIAGNGISNIGEINLPNLRHLDLSDNQLTGITFDDVSRLSQLETLLLSGNPLLSLFHCTKNMPKEPKSLTYPENTNATVNTCDQLRSLNSLSILNLSRVKIRVFNSSFLSFMPNLHNVNMSESSIETLVGDGIQSLKHLRALDLRGCPLTHIPRNLFAGLKELETVYSDNLKMCCAANLPADFPLKNCHAPVDELSSCEALLKFNVYRIFLSAFAFLAVFGNASSFFYRVLLRKKKQLLSFDIFVVHLSGSDFLMGVYLGMIGVADHLYQGTYLWEDIKWMNSAACKIAGFLCLVSSEVSALVICLITVDRFLVVRFPFSTFHFRAHSAQVASTCAWGMGCLIAAVPLVPGVSAWHFYGQTGICIPLPVSRSDSPGYIYVLGVMIGANFVFFLVTAAGQVLIYCSVHSNSFSVNHTSRKSHDVTIARRLITVAMSDFLCWFPIGLVGLLAATGTPITGEVNVAMAIFVLPFNSALNPFLYTLNIMLENRRKSNEELLKKRLIAQFYPSEYIVTSDYDIISTT